MLPHDVEKSNCEIIHYHHLRKLRQIEIWGEKNGVLTSEYHKVKKLLDEKEVPPPLGVLRFEGPENITIDITIDITSLDKVYTVGDYFAISFLEMIDTKLCFVIQLRFDVDNEKAKIKSKLHTMAACPDSKSNDFIQLAKQLQSLEDYQSTTADKSLQTCIADSNSSQISIGPFSFTCTFKQ